MIDLSKIPTKDLEGELQRRLDERRKARFERKICTNCAYRIRGSIREGLYRSECSWVCHNKPKRPSKTGYFREVPEYHKTYYACDNRKFEGCEMFINIRSEEGREIHEKLTAIDKLIKTPSLKKRKL